MIVVTAITIVGYLIRFPTALFFPIFFTDYSFEFSFLSASMLPIIIGQAINIFLLLTLIILCVVSKKSVAGISIYSALTALSLGMVFQYAYEFDLNLVDLILPIAVSAGAFIISIFQLIAALKYKQFIKRHPIVSSAENNLNGGQND